MTAKDIRDEREKLIKEQLQCEQRLHEIAQLLQKLIIACPHENKIRLGRIEFQCQDCGAWGTFL